MFFSMDIYFTSLSLIVLSISTFVNTLFELIKAKYYESIAMQYYIECFSKVTKYL
jgi:hypothetical protein